MNRHDRRRLRDAPEIRVELRDKHTGTLIDALSVQADHIDDAGLVTYVIRATTPMMQTEFRADVIPARSAVVVEYVP